MKANDFITLEQLAKEMEVSETTVREWRQRKMPVIKIEKFVRVYRPGFFRWLLDQKDEGTENGSGE